MEVEIRKEDGRKSASTRKIDRRLIKTDPMRRKEGSLGKLYSTYGRYITSPAVDSVSNKLGGWHHFQVLIYSSLFTVNGSKLI